MFHRPSRPSYFLSVVNTQHSDNTEQVYRNRDDAMRVCIGKTNGQDNYLVINGHARVTEGGAPNC